MIGAMVGLFISFVSIILNDYSNIRRQKEAARSALELQEDQQAFNAEQSKEAREWQEEMYLKYLSPEAKYNSAKSLGVNETSSLMNALGMSSIPSGPAASSGIASSPVVPPMDWSSAVSSLFDNAKTYFETEGQNISNEYAPQLNEANINSMLNRISLDNKRFDLDLKTFNQVTKPLADSTLGLNWQELQNKSQQLSNMRQEYTNLQAQFHQILAQTGNINAQTLLIGAQTEGQIIQNQYAPDLLSSQIDNNKASAFAQFEQGRALKFDNDMSALVGFNVKLDWKQNALSLLGRAFDQLENNESTPLNNRWLKTGLKGVLESSPVYFLLDKAGVKVPADDFFNIVGDVYKYGMSALHYKATANRAWNMTTKFLHDKYGKYRRGFDPYFNDAKKEVEQNLRYGF